MKLAEIIKIMEEIAPIQHAESWDNVGLLVGDPSQEVKSTLLTIDYTMDVAEEAKSKQCDLIISYHPTIFGGIKRVTSTGSTCLVFDAVRRGVAIYSPHTALDIAPGGTNDMLADAIGMTERQPMKMLESKSMQYKLVTFVPEKDVEIVSQALFEAGAGRIGNYSSCSFRSRGSGTFFGEAGTNPAIGKSGQFEQADEIRLETVVPISALERVIVALRQSHPYEEPAFDLNQLAAAPSGLGMGRIGTFASTSREQVIERIKRELNLTHVLVAGPTSGNITRAAVCAGSCGDLLNDAIAQKAELYLTGEIRHHDAVKAAAAGVTVVCVLHSNSERAVLKRLAARLLEALPGLAVAVSQQDRDPFAVK